MNGGGRNHTSMHYVTLYYINQILLVYQKPCLRQGFYIAL